MKNRLKEFMELKSLNAADLADMIGVQRSNVSHILNGRNNPSSLFISKLLNCFTDLDARWLLTGEGEILKPVNAGHIESPTVAAAPPKAVTQSVNSENVEKVFRSKSGKKIERIVFFHEDGSFRDYFPG